MSRVVGVEEILEVDGPATLLRRLIAAVADGVTGGVFFGHKGKRERDEEWGFEGKL